jgi:protein FAM50
MVNDATVEKDESHPGKVAERRWYERNKHIFPASRWEVYDPKVNRDDQKYTIHGGEVVAGKHATSSSSSSSSR